MIRAFALVALTFAAQAAACSKASDDCTTAEDCSGSSAALSAGRCGPELACVDGRCHAECLGTCAITQTRIPADPCANGGICDQPAKATTTSSNARCTKREIHCTTSDDCPLQRPTDAGSWSCEAGVCAFPGFAFEYR